MTLLDPLHHSDFCTCLSKKLLSWELLPFCTRKQHSHTNMQSCLLSYLFHSGNEEWETLFYQKTSYSFCQQTGWTLRKSSRILSMHWDCWDATHTKCFVGRKALPRLSDNLPSQACPPNRVTKGELWRRVITRKCHPNWNECFNLWQRPYVFEEKKILSPPKLAPAVRLLPSFENYSVQIGNIATLPSCNVLFFAKKKKHLQLCELHKRHEITYKLYKYTGLKA